MWWLERSVGIHIDVSCLVWCKLCQLGSQLGKVQGSHLLIKVLGQHIHLLLVAAAAALIP